MLRAIFFDIDDTLYSTSAFARRARESSIDAMIALGLQYPRAEALRELDEVIREFSSNYASHFDKLLGRIPSSYYEGINPALLVAAGMVAYHETKFRELRPFPDVAEVLPRLARQPLVLGVITNGLTIKQAEKLLRLNLVPCFHRRAIFISEQVGIWKINPKLYLRACETVGVSPQEAMYVGDHPLLDVDPPNTLGMVTVLCRREDRKLEGRRLEENPRTRPVYTIGTFYELEEILARDYHLKRISTSKVRGQGRKQVKSRGR